MPEELGSFKTFCELVGPINITEFKYRYDNNREEALVLYSVGVHEVSELRAMVGRMESSQLRTVDLTNNDLAKDHLRHLMGGRSNVKNELLCRFVFPERPGALMKFLNSFSPRWNISLFHYRAQVSIVFSVYYGKSQLNFQFVPLFCMFEVVEAIYSLVNVSFEIVLSWTALQ
ncbi:unnamed protein product [Victoria cruziana]